MCIAFVGFYNVPVDSFMIGSINVEVYYDNVDDPDLAVAKTGGCSELEIIAVSIRSQPGNDSWDGTFCR